MIHWEKVFTGAGWFHWTGITPAISDGVAEVCREAIITAKKMGLTVSCDLNFRKNLWRWGRSANEIMPDLVKHCDIIRGNGS